MSKTTNQQKVIVLKIWLADLIAKRPKKKTIIIDED